MSQIKSINSLLSGYLRVHHNLTLYENDHFVINSRNDISDKSRVKLISGGGSGHEPAHMGYVGEGMLTASVCGDLYSSPSVQHILNAILAVGTPDTSILLIIKNYTGDRLNFGIALEHAKNYYKYKYIDMVVINDDISIDDSKTVTSVGRRGLAGTIFYHKIIGALAANQKSFEFIKQYVNRLLTNNIICSIGFTFTSSPDGIHNIEIGKGIHGEPGIHFIHNSSGFEQFYELLLAKFQSKIPKTSKIIIMVNNLGGTSNFIMNIFVDGISKKFSNVYTIVNIYAGTFLTSLNTQGISVTLINLSDPKDLIDILKFLEYRTDVPCNVFEVNVVHRAMNKSIIKDTVRINAHGEQRCISKFERDQHVVLFHDIIVHCAHDLIVNADLLNKIDAEFGDGDTGSTLLKFANEIKLQISNATLNEFDNPKKIIMQLANIAENSVGGTTGALYCLFFQGVMSAIPDDVTVTLSHWIAGIQAGVVTIMKYGHAQKGDRTMLDPLIACSEALQQFTTIKDLKKVCDDAVNETQHLIPKAGRAVYSFSMSNKPKTAKYPDSGAKAVGIIFNAIAEQIINFK